MSDNELALQIEALNQKVDFLVEQMRLQQEKQREWEELKRDLVLIGKDAFQVAVNELNEVAPYFDSKDLKRLIKKLLRNTRNLDRLVDHLESASAFFDDARPLGKAAFASLLENLEQLEERGYLDFFREVLKILDTVVTSFTVEDIRLLRENVTSILLTVKNLTQPEMLSTMNHAVGFYQKMDIMVEHSVSYRKILKALKDPEVKRGIVFLLEFVKNMANSNGQTASASMQSTHNTIQEA